MLLYRPRQSAKAQSQTSTSLAAMFRRSAITALARSSASLRLTSNNALRYTLPCSRNFSTVNGLLRNAEQQQSKAAEPAAAAAAAASTAAATPAQEEDMKLKIEQMNLRKKIFRIRNWIIPGIFLTLIMYYVMEEWKEEKKLEIQATQQSKNKQTLAAGKASIGGSFTLVDTNGVPVTDSSFRGKWLMIYFGFTNCPDICPEEMKKMTKVLQLIGDKYSNKIQPLFISCDPRRDSCEAIVEYLQDFHPNFIGLTGTPEQINNVCKKYRVYYTAPDYEEGKEDYLVDHSVFIYFMDPYGYFNAYYARHLSAEEMARQVKSSIEQFDAEMAQRKAEKLKQGQK